jgi:ABC-2 type transport system ATP-binding protein
MGAHRIGALSRGYRQRVGLAQALVHDPPVLVLDEPTTGLDPRQRVEVRELLRRLGRSRTVLLSSHLLAEVADLCRRVVVLDRGRVVAVERVAALAAASGIRLELRVDGNGAVAARAARSVPGVESAEVRGGLVVVYGSGDRLAQAVAAAVVEAGLGLEELHQVATSLEAAYLRLVKG